MTAIGMEPEMGWTHGVETDAGSMECFPLTGARFEEMEAVFGDRGVARDCFCMYWRRPDGGFDDARDNRDRFAEFVEQGPPPGLIACIEGEPVGWVQVGPREHFPTLFRSRLLKPVDDLQPWTINCFVVRVGHRRHGIGRGLLEGAIEYAKWNGAEVIEAHPVDGPRSSAVDY